MIRVNLLGVERPAVKSGFTFDESQRVTLAVCVILIATVVGLGRWYWTLSETSARLDEEIVAAQQEQIRLQTVIAEVGQFEQRRGQLQQRVALIEDLRRGQSLPVQLLDHVSRSVPDLLWLTQLEQEGAAVTIHGRSTTLIGLSDFVANLGSGTLLQRPIEIVDSQVETVTATGPDPVPDTELISFTVRAQLPAQGTAGATP